MGESDKLGIEIVYCVPCSYHGAAIGLLADLYQAGGNSVSLKLTPGAGGVFQVFLDGEKVFDKGDEGGRYPDVDRVKKIKAQVRDRLGTVTAAAD